MNFSIRQLAKDTCLTLSDFISFGSSARGTKGSRTARKRALARSLRVETLESRNLSAVDVSLSADGILRVVGDNEHNYIDLFDSNGYYGLYTVRNRLDSPSDEPVVKMFPQTAVKSLFVDGRGGDDYILNRTNVPMVAFGGSGVDALHGGTGVNQLYDSSNDTDFQNRGLVANTRGLLGIYRNTFDLDQLSDYYRTQPIVAATLGLPTNNGQVFGTALGTRYRTYENGIIIFDGRSGNLTHIYGEILKKWQSLGGIDNKTLGNPQSQVLDFSGAKLQNFEYGAIVDRGSSGTFEIHGAIYNTWLRDANIRKRMGLPKSDEFDTADGKGRQSNFEGGQLIWDRATGKVTMKISVAQLIAPNKALDATLLFMTSVTPVRLAGQNISSAADALYTQLGREKGALGAIVRGEKLIASKMVFVTEFKNGAIYRTPSSTFAVYGDIYRKYVSKGGPTGILGLPRNNETAVGDAAGGRFNRFEYGEIYWTPSRGAFEIHGSILQEWIRRGGTKSSLGYPISDELVIGPYGEFCLSKFQNGALSYSAGTGVLTIEGALHRQWTSMGAEQSYLGVPLAVSKNISVGILNATTQEFAGGTLSVFLNQPQTGLTAPRVNFRFDQMKWALQNLANAAPNLDATRMERFTSLIQSQNTMPEHVRNLAEKLILGDTANRFYRGRFNGNLSVGMSRINRLNLVDQWFGGGERPRAVDDNLSHYQYAEAKGPLFGYGGPAIFDADQGSLGDCYFIAALGSLAARNPQAIRNMFIDNGDGTLTVRFFNEGKAEYVTIDWWLPSRDGKLVYANGGRPVVGQSPLWAALAEKAFVILSESGWSGQSVIGEYGHDEDDGVNGGWSHDVLKMVANISAKREVLQYVFEDETGQKIIHLPNSEMLLNSFRQSMMNPANWKTVISTSKEFVLRDGVKQVPQLTGPHAYILWSADDNGITLFNPWGFTSNTSPFVSVSWEEAAGNLSAWTHY